MPMCPMPGHPPWVLWKGDDCPMCKKMGIKALSVEYDKQDRVRTTLVEEGYRFEPTRSRALMVFTVPESEKSCQNK